MPPSSITTFEFGDGKPSVDVAFELTAQSRSYLEGFLAEAMVLQDAMLRMGDAKWSYRMTLSVDQPPQVSGEEPNADQRAILLYRLRPFVLEKERYFFQKARTALAQSSTSTFLQDRLKDVKTLFTSKNLSEQVLVNFSGLNLNSEAALQKWLNAFEYHRDESKAIELIKAHEFVSIESSRPLFMMMLQHKARATLHLAYIANKMLNDAREAPAPCAGA